jgi:hypothetical protein
MLLTPEMFLFSFLYKIIFTKDFYSFDFKEAWVSSRGVVLRVGLMEFSLRAGASWLEFRLSFKSILLLKMEFIDNFSSSSLRSTFSLDQTVC